ncbi:hypothetical protein [Acinetobacter sp. UBA6720]|uniref:hypothetical protein n=1 Tax=Acinetobacter sp. UBA6720 TaxID=1945953 RepID=UPI0025C046BA|nr:hypothetical protein [Acinetobacter sp. UBA6720]
MLKKFSEAIGHITCFATFLIVSITLSGLIFFDSFTKGLKYNISILDIDFYSLLVQFLIVNHSGLIGYSVSVFIILFIFFEFFPKAFNFILGIFHFLYLILLKFFNGLVLLLLQSLLMPIVAILVVVNWMLNDWLYKSCIWFLDIVTKLFKYLDRHSKTEQNQIKNTYQIEEGYKHYEKGSFWIVVALGLLIVWLKWIVLFGTTAEKYIENLKKADARHWVYLKMGDEKIKPVPSILLFKTKEGYLVISKETDNFNKAVIYSNNIVIKIEPK